MGLVTGLRTLKAFSTYAAVLALVIGLAGLAVHVLIAQQYRTAETDRLSALAHDAQQELHETEHSETPADALSEAVKFPDEGAALLDSTGRRVARSGLTDTRDALVRRVPFEAETLQLTISNTRVTALLRELDLGLAAGGIAAVFAGAILITIIARRSLARVESAFERVHRFTGDAAHELRTPLTVIASNVDDLGLESDDRSINDQSRANIRQATEQMSALIDGLLVLAREDGAAQAIHAIDLATLLEDVLDRYRFEARARKLNLRLTAPAGLSLYGRPEQVERIIGNLLENALRYTPSGGNVEIRAYSERATIFIHVADTGIGIPPESQEQIFERFWRAERNRSSTGFGLGLAIARTFAHAHGGDISVKSSPGAGSVFTVKLPSHPRRPVFSTIS
jgi:signal transduction histidine kinase